MGSLKGTVGFGVRVPLTLRLSLVFRAFCGMHACVCVCLGFQGVLLTCVATCRGLSEFWAIRDLKELNDLG